MRAEYIKKAAGYAGISVAELAREIGQSPANVANKMARGTLKDDELEAMAKRLGARYKVYFEFPDGTQIGDK